MTVEEDDRRNIDLHAGSDTDCAREIYCGSMQGFETVEDRRERIELPASSAQEKEMKDEK
jgi:hypothetical protein